MRAFFCCIVLLLAGVAQADRLVTRDGRVLELRRARLLPDGSGYRLTFEHGVIDCPARFVALIESTTFPGEAPGEGADGSALAALTARTEFAQGWERETAHFRLKTNTSPELLAWLARLLEGFYGQMLTRFEASAAVNGERIRVDLHRDRADWARHHPDTRGVVGRFDPRDGSLSLFHDHDEPTFTQWAALHECMHLLLHRIRPRSLPASVAPWLQEGIADYFGSAEVRDDGRGGLLIVPGKLLTDRILTVQAELAAGRALPLEELFQLEPAAFGNIEYAHAWSFVYFLEESPDHGPDFETFLVELFGTPPEVETPQMLALDVQRRLLAALAVREILELDREWRAFVEEIELETPAVRFQRAYRLVLEQQVERFPEALVDLDAALAGGLVDARAHWARGVVRVRSSGGADGLEDLERAVELAPLKAGFRFTLARALAGLSTLGPRVGWGAEARGDARALQRARREFGLAAELEPKNHLYRRTAERFAAATSRRVALGPVER